MSTSMQTVGNKAEYFRDLDLLALICLMSDGAQGTPDAFPAIVPIVAMWSRELANYGPGVIDLNLDVIASSEDLARDFGTLLSTVAARINGFGQTVPSSYLNGQCRAPGVTFADYSATLLLQALEKLRSLVSSR